MPRSNFIQQAFNLVCDDAIKAEKWCVALKERTRVYLGPWEGGTYGDDIEVISYKWYDTKEQAEAVKAEVEKVAKEMTEQASKSHGRYCQMMMDWLEARGLEADFLPEPDGPSEYYVTIENDYPTGCRSSREYA
jgi:hypothetical protein